MNNDDQSINIPSTSSPGEIASSSRPGCFKCGFPIPSLLEDLDPQFVDAFRQMNPRNKTRFRKPTAHQKNELYAWYMQAVYGDNHTRQPRIFGVERWRAWKYRAGQSKSAAQTNYVVLVKLLEREGIEQD